MRRFDPQALHVPDKFLHPLVRIADALDAVPDAGHRPYGLLHVREEVVHRHLVVHGVFEPAARVGHRAAEARADHDQAGGHGLGHADARAGRDDRAQRTAHAGPVVRREHHDAFDDLGLLLGDQALVPEQSDHVRDFVPLVDQLGGGIAVVTGFVAAVVADRRLDEGRDHHLAGLHPFLDGLGELRQVFGAEVRNRPHQAALDQLLVSRLDGGAQRAKRFRDGRAGLLEGVGLGARRPFALHAFLGAGVPELHPLRQALLAEAGDHRQQLDPPLLRAVPLGGALFQLTAHLADDHDCLGLRVLLEHLQVGHIIGAGVGVAADPDRRRDAIGELRADPDDLVGEAAGLRDDPEGPFPVELARHQIVERAPDYAEPALARRNDPDGRGPVEDLAELRRVASQQFGVLLGHALGDHGDDLDLRIVQRLHTGRAGPVGPDVHQARVDLRMMRRGLPHRLVDRNGQQTVAVGDFVRLAGVRRIDEGFHVQRALDHVTEFRHAPRGVQSGRAALDDDPGVFISQNTHSGSPRLTWMTISSGAPCRRCR